MIEGLFILKACALILLIISAIITFPPELEYFAFASEMLEQFRVQLSFVLISVFIFMLVKQYYLLSAAQLTLVLYSLYIILSSYPISNLNSSCVNDEARLPLRVLSFNTYYKNLDYDNILRTIETTNADIIILQEAQFNFLNTAHELLSTTYPFYYPKTENGETIGATLYSRYPIVEAKPVKVFDHKYSGLQAKIDVMGNIVNLIGLHAKSPKSKALINERNDYIEQLANVAEEVSLNSKHFIIAGDFNTVPWHKEIRSLTKRAALNHNTIYDYFGTWPSWGLPIITIPIDNIFYNNGFYKASYYRGDSSGSDHYPIYTDLYFCK